MSETAELIIRQNVSPEIDQRLPDALTTIIVKGTLRRRAIQWSGVVAAVPQKVAELTDVQGETILILVDDTDPPAIRAAWLGHSFMAVSGVSSIFWRPTTAAVVGHMRPEVAYQESEVVPLAFKGPDGLYPGAGTDRPVIYGLSVFSAPWISGRSEIWLDVGTWRMVFLEFEPGTVELQVLHE